MRTITYERLDIDNDENIYKERLNNFPESCPRCNTVQEPKFINAYKLTPLITEAIFKCNKKDCGHLFLSELIYGLDGYILMKSYPKYPETIEFKDEISKLSPLFVEIYNQANVAETLNLNHVAGMGYRKSLEFLIKDYLIKFKHEDEDTIKKASLSTCIKKHLSANIKQVAERATWLGNDETHYHRVWEDRDIEDLKTLIDLSVYWMSSEMDTAKYISEMENRKGKSSPIKQKKYPPTIQQS